MSANPETIRPWQAGLDVMNKGKPLATMTPDTILARLHYESAKQIADSLNISRIALYDWLLRNCPEKWQAISSARSLDKIDQADEVFDNRESTGLDISRARESARLASWQLERVSRMYAAKQEINQGVSITVQVHRTDDAQAKCVTIEQDPPVPLPGALSDGGGGK